MNPKVWADFTDYVTGDEVARLQAKLPGGRKADPPSWELVLDFEHEMRKFAYARVADHGDNMAQALVAATTNENIRGLHFTTPYQTEVMISSTRGAPGKRPYHNNQFGVSQIADAFSPTAGPSAQETPYKEKAKRAMGRRARKEKARRWEW